MARNAAKNAAVTTANDPANYARNLIKGISFKNCISKINETLIGNAEDLDVAIPMYNLLEYSKNYRKATGSLWNYYRYEPTSDVKINHYLGSKSFEFKSSTVGEVEDINKDNQAKKNKIKFIVPLKHLSILWRSL